MRVFARLVLPCTLLWCSSASEQQPAGLQVVFGAHGVERILWRGQTVEDVSQHPQDQLHIWHMNAFDLSGQDLTSGEYGWGENNRGRTWDYADKAWTYRYDWGSIRVQYALAGDALDLKVTETNDANSGVVLDGATVYPVTLHLRGASGAGVVDDIAQPGVTFARFESGQLAVVVPDESKPVYSGLQATEDGVAVIASGTRPDGFRKADAPGRAIKPGQSDSFIVSLRFADGHTSREQIAADAYGSFAKRWPATLHWTDRRAIGTVYLANSPQGDKTRSGGYANNPRRYFNVSDGGEFDVRSAAGLERFQARVLKQAEDVVENLRRLDAQGAITWDLEGEEFPQDTSYVCSPDAIAEAAPEMESTIAGKSSRYAGMKLDDAYFKTIRDAGFRVGVCVRPQRFEMEANGSARQVPLSDREAQAELIRKMRYAHERWGATLFYVDSTVGADGTTIDSSAIEAAAAALPDSLVIPEEATPRMYRAAAPFLTFLFHGDLSTPSWIRDVYPHAFSANLVNDADANKLATHRAELTDEVRKGDILMVYADYWLPNNDMVRRIYLDARR